MVVSQTLTLLLQWAETYDVWTFTKETVEAEIGAWLNLCVLFCIMLFKQLGSAVTDNRHGDGS